MEEMRIKANANALTEFTKCFQRELDLRLAPQRSEGDLKRLSEVIKQLFKLPEFRYQIARINVNHSPASTSELVVFLEPGDLFVRCLKAVLAGDWNFFFIKHKEFTS